jgi:tetratricopeptide (TPR) repeat protein
VSQYSQAFQDRFNFLLGRFFREYGEDTRALEFLNRVSPEATDRARAHYLAGIILLGLDQNARAVEEFTNAIARTEVNRTESDIAEVAYLAIARIAYEVNQFDAALYYYYKVPRSSFRYGRALFESMWAYYLKGDWNRTLGVVHSLNSPYHQHAFRVDVPVVEVATYLNTCQLENAEEAVV